MRLHRRGPLSGCPLIAALAFPLLVVVSSLLGRAIGGWYLLPFRAQIAVVMTWFVVPPLGGLLRVASTNRGQWRTD